MATRKSNTPKRYTTAFNYGTGVWRQQYTPRHSLARDNDHVAKLPGWRPVYKNGKIDHWYFERRVNRSDTPKQLAAMGVMPMMTPIKKAAAPKRKATTKKAAAPKSKPTTKKAATSTANKFYLKNKSEIREVFRLWHALKKIAIICQEKKDVHAGYYPTTVIYWERKDPDGGYVYVDFAELKQEFETPEQAKRYLEHHAPKQSKNGPDWERAGYDSMEAIIKPNLNIANIAFGYCTLATR